MKKMLLIGTFLLLAACAGEKGAKGDKGDSVPVPTVTPLEQDIQNLVNEENEYRLTLGQTVLTSGLSCSVQQVSSGQRISSSSPSGLGAVIVITGTRYTFLLKDEINFTGGNMGVQNDLLPSALRPVFQSLNYLLRCEGQLVVTETDYYNFELNSDDGSILTIDGSVVINNDGNHGMTVKTGFKHLRRGVSQFKLEYAQTGSGASGLVLTSSGETIHPMFLFH